MHNQLSSKEFGQTDDWANDNRRYGNDALLLGKFVHRLSKAVLLIALLVGVPSALLAVQSSPLAAQTSSTKLTSAPKELELPNPSTYAAIRKLISELDDKQVRTLLIKKFAKEVDRQNSANSAVNQIDLVSAATTAVRKVANLFGDATAKVPRIPGETGRAWNNFAAKRQDRSVLWLIASLVVALGLGTVAGSAGWRGVRRFMHRKGTGSEAVELTGRQAFVFNIFAVFLPVALFVFAAWIINTAVNFNAEADHALVSRIIAIVGWTGFAAAVAKFALQPTLAEWRACHIANGASQYLTQRITIAALIFNGGFGLIQWMNAYGSPYEATWLGLWINLAFHSFLILSIWQGRRGISGIVAGSHTLAESTTSPFPSLWPYMLMGLLGAHWLVIEIIVATANVPDNLFVAMAITLSVLAGLPIIGHAIQATILNLLPVSDDIEPALQAAEHSTRSGATRVIKVAVTTVLFIGLFSLWGFDITKLAADTVGGKLANAIVDIVVICGVAYALWEIVRIATERQIAAEQVALGIDPTAGVEAGTEGGGAGARLGTVLPLVQFAAQVALISLALLAILGELGVNVIPILAGAGIVGLAIGFGAQTLVKDIISGVFFLVDDAFRKGEFIETGDVKGTVERISIRSMQLRHHNGPLNTVPYGEIRHVTNFSRDWVVMKLPLRLTYDTDSERVRKMIKKLGEEMKEDPVLGPLFLQPLKSQGVIQMEDSAMIMRVKFMTRPGDQWGIRRVVFARIRDLFEEHGIKFASREVTVRIADDEARPLSPEGRARAAGSAARTIQEVSS